MITILPLDRYLTRHPIVSALLYVALVIALFLIVFFALADVAARHRILQNSAETLARLKAHVPHSASEAITTDSGPAGSPFLEGPTVTVASAALLQRITSAISRVGGSVVSSEVAPQGVHSKDGYVRVIVSCEIEQAVLQDLLYDFEAGKPFLFVDQLVVQAPSTATEGGRMRVLLGLSGLWRAAQ
jgi:general secretion pathway protein M